MVTFLYFLDRLNDVVSDDSTPMLKLLYKDFLNMVILVLKSNFIWFLKMKARVNHS